MNELKRERVAYSMGAIFASVCWLALVTLLVLDGIWLWLALLGAALVWLGSLMFTIMVWQRTS